MLKYLRTNHRLNHLIVDKNNLSTNYAFAAIALVIAAGTTLRNFSAANCNLSDYFGKSFAESMKSNRGLAKLNLYGNMLTCTTLSLLADAIRISPGKLTHINLGKNHLKDKGGTKFGETLARMNSLVKIDLSDNNLTDETAIAINKSLPFAISIKELNLGMNLIHIRQLEMIQA